MALDDLDLTDQDRQDLTKAIAEYLKALSVTIPSMADSELSEHINSTMGKFFRGKIVDSDALSLSKELKSIKSNHHSYIVMWTHGNGQVEVKIGHTSQGRRFSQLKTSRSNEWSFEEVQVIRVPEIAGDKIIFEKCLHFVLEAFNMNKKGGQLNQGAREFFESQHLEHYQRVQRLLADALDNISDALKNRQPGEDLTKLIVEYLQIKTIIDNGSTTIDYRPRDVNAKLKDNQDLDKSANDAQANGDNRSCLPEKSGKFSNENIALFSALKRNFFIVMSSSGVEYKANKANKAKDRIAWHLIRRHLHEHGYCTLITEEIMKQKNKKGNSNSLKDDWKNLKEKLKKRPVLWGALDNDEVIQFDEDSRRQLAKEIEEKRNNNNNNTPPRPYQQLKSKLTRPCSWADDKHHPKKVKTAAEKEEEAKTETEE